MRGRASDEGASERGEWGQHPEVGEISKPRGWMCDLTSLMRRYVIGLFHFIYVFSHLYTSCMGRGVCMTMSFCVYQPY